LIVVLCPNSSRHASVKAYAGAGPIEFVSLPLGPYKLARGLKLGFEKLEQLSSGSTNDGTTTSVEDTIDGIIEPMARATLHSDFTPAPDIPIIQQGQTVGARESSNAQMALDAFPVESEGSKSSEEQTEYPFPADPASNIMTIDEIVSIPLPQSPITDPGSVLNQPLTPGAHRPRPQARRTISATKTEMLTYEPTAASPMSSAGAKTNARGGSILPDQKEDESTPQTRSPRLLLVDDNKVNLRLLQTFMKKRNYTDVYLAEDGEQAVTTFQQLIQKSPPQPPDIVLMDISMPVLDGFAATRQIRKIEEQMTKQLSPMETPAPSLIIALTGLASGRDQSEAFVSGFDLYMTKPVSFREVGRLLDNWQANGGTQRSGVPHGPVTGAIMKPKDAGHDDIDT
jgi:CheY-like chemotaxis protein